jgi:hypothetical protein
VAALAAVAGIWLSRHTRIAALTPAELAPWVHAPTPPHRITKGCPEVKQALALSSSSSGSGHEQPIKNTTPLDADEIAIYRTVLERRLSQGWTSLNVSDVTYLLDLTSDQSGMNCDCLQDIYLQDSSAFHAFHELTADILPGKKMVLVDPAKQATIVRANDPDRTMRMGKTADEAVNNTFATGLFSLSEIAFDRSHHYAIVRYGFWCGFLCGNGATLVLEKIGDRWKVTDRQCGGWIS